MQPATESALQPALDNPDMCVTMLHIYDTVKWVGLPNYCGTKVALPHGLNIPAWTHYLRNYDDKQLVDFLQYGFPVNYCASWPPAPVSFHHSSAIHYPEHVEHYINTEVGHNALCGPFIAPLFTPWFQTNALMTRDKKNSDKRRIIVNLSFPPGLSVNSGIPTDTYHGQPYKLSLPCANDLKDYII